MNFKNQTTLPMIAALLLVLGCSEPSDAATAAPAAAAPAATAAADTSSSSDDAMAMVDPALPVYATVGGVAGNLSSVGSDTLANLMTLWAEDFRRFYPNVNIQIQAAGSSTAPPALTEGTSNLGPMSRMMKAGEIEAFEERYGYPPTAVAVAIDALAVFVNKDNPIEGLTMQQVDAIFSSNRTCGYPTAIDSWGDLGLSGAWGPRTIQLYGRNSVSGTYGYFKEEALCKGDYRASVNEQPGSASVVQGVAASLNGIGYSGIGYVTSGVRALPLAAEEGAPFVAASPANASSGEYPLSRFLYVYVNVPPGGEMSPLEREFLTMVLSRQGQAVVVKDGYIPLPAAVAARELARIR